MMMRCQGQLQVLIPLIYVYPHAEVTTAIGGSQPHARRVTQKHCGDVSFDPLLWQYSKSKDTLLYKHRVPSIVWQCGRKLGQ